MLPSFRRASLPLCLLLLACDDTGSDVPRVTLPASPGGQGGAGQAGQAGNSGGAGQGGAAGKGGQAGAGQAGAGAGSGGGGAGQTGAPEPAQQLYPTPRALFDKAISPSCALNQGQCHGGWASPDLTSFEALAALSGAPCQQRAGNGAIVSNECEPPGDRLAFADGVERTILAVVVPPDAPAVPAEVAVFLDGAPGIGDMTLVQGDQKRSLLGASLVEELEGGAVRLDLSGLPGLLANAWDVREWPRPAGSVHEADPNGDGVLGASLGVRQIVPFDTDRSYLYQRLLSDRLGPRMPLVQGLWRPEAVRAVQCWIKGGLVGADQPIDYDNCPPDLTVVTGFSAVASISKNKCAIPGCHSASSMAGGLDMSPTAEAFTALLSATSIQAPGVALIVPGKPDESYLYCKSDPACDKRAEGTALMPKGLGQLGETELGRLREWIEQGAKIP